MLLAQQVKDNLQMPFMVLSSFAEDGYVIYEDQNQTRQYRPCLLLAINPKLRRVKQLVHDRSDNCRCICEPKRYHLKLVVPERCSESSLWSVERP